MAIYESEPTNYAVPPGETLAEWLDERDMSQGQLAQRLNRSTKHVNQIVNGVAPILPSTAIDLEFVTGIPARFWLAREAAYREDLERIKRSEEIGESVEWLSEIPVKDLRRLGFVSAPAGDKAALVVESLRFFGVPTVQTWRDLYLQPQAAFRQSRVHEISPGAVATWLRLGQLEAEQRHVPRFNPHVLRRQLPAMRALSASRGPVGSHIVELAAEAGVVVAFIPDIAGTRASGATHWVRSRPIVQLSLRGKTDDRFWFTLFHEIAHVLLDDRGDVFIESAGSSNDVDDRERRADEFAGEVLIPSAQVPELARLRSLEEVREFALRIGVSPGVVVGRLHHDGTRPWSWGARLKARVDFAPTDASPPPSA
ncbi:MAG: ImmA/IrrE family metallo-endopeptidase [Actinomycetales bacterium]